MLFKKNMSVLLEFYRHAQFHITTPQSRESFALCIIALLCSTYQHRTRVHIYTRTLTEGVHRRNIWRSAQPKHTCAALLTVLLISPTWFHGRLEGWADLSATGFNCSDLQIPCTNSPSELIYSAKTGGCKCLYSLISAITYTMCSPSQTIRKIPTWKKKTFGIYSAILVEMMGFLCNPFQCNRCWCL